MTFTRRTKSYAMVLPIFLLCFATAGNPCLAHEGPEPVAKWSFSKTQVDGRALKAVIGPDATVKGAIRFEQINERGSIHFDGTTTCIYVGDRKDESLRGVLPKKRFTVAALVDITKPMAFGGIVGCFQDNGEAETGWVLGFDNQSFIIGLSTQGADDGNGDLLYLKGKTNYKPGKLYHIVATYDGDRLNLYVDGELDAQSDIPSGDILYPETSPFVIGAYRDENENFRMAGRISEVAIYQDVASDEWVSHQFAHAKKFVDTKPARIRPSADENQTHRFVVDPFLQWATQDGITVTWETNQRGESSIYWGSTVACANQLKLDVSNEFASEGVFIYQGRIAELDSGTQYFYKVITVGPDQEELSSEVFTFQTASDEDAPFAFAAISDTQGNYEVANTIATMAWEQRPNFLLHPGDLVQKGKQKKHWTEVFFPSMHPLISRVPIYPVLGNHEYDAAFYYHYMDLPEPEYYYTFTYGNAQFFMLDSNRNCQKGSEQYKWLDTELEQSKATWKIVCHHHPPYSSDENDFGDLWKTNISTRGAVRVKDLTRLYDQHKVEIVWTGHIHSYERTWPIFNGEPTDVGGTLYMITGGGGGGLEKPGPFRNPFTNVLKVGHHYTMVHVNGRRLEARVYTDDGQLFDTFTIDKSDSNMPK